MTYIILLIQITKKKIQAKQVSGLILVEVDLLESFSGILNLGKLIHKVVTFNTDGCSTYGH